MEGKRGKPTTPIQKLKRWCKEDSKDGAYQTPSISKIISCSYFSKQSNRNHVAKIEAATVRNFCPLFFLLVELVNVDEPSYAVYARSYPVDTFTNNRIVCT